MLIVLLQLMGSIVYAFVETELRKFIPTVSCISKTWLMLTESTTAYAWTKGFYNADVEKVGIKSLNCKVFWDIVTIELKGSVKLSFIWVIISPFPSGIQSENRFEFVPNLRFWNRYTVP